MVRSRKLAVTVLIGLIATTATVSLAVASGRGRHPTRPSLSENRILSIALTAARTSGDPHPTLVQHSEGTRARANLLTTGAAESGNAWSYLIAERGRFVLNSAPRPPGAPAPHGTVLTIVVGARSGRITDLGTSNHYPRLAALGPVTTDLAASVHAMCAASAPNPVSSSRPGADHRLVVPGARTLLLCRYRGTPNLMPGPLVQQRLIASQRTVSSLATDLNGIPKTPVYPCPSSNGSEILAYFRYRVGPDDPVQIQLGGCEIVTNGHLVRLAGVTARGRRAVAQLKAALRG